MNDEAKLTHPKGRRHKKFCERYVVHFNGTMAATEAGYGAKYANRTSVRLLKRQDVKRYIAVLVEQQKKDSNMQAADVKERLCNEVEADLVDLFDDDGTLRPVKQWPKIWRQGLIASIESGVDTYGNPKMRIRLADRAKRIEMLGRHLKMFTDKVEGSIEHQQIKAEQDALSRARREFTTDEITRLNALVMQEQIDAVQAVERIEKERNAH